MGVSGLILRLVCELDLLSHKTLGWWSKKTLVLFCFDLPLSSEVVDCGHFHVSLLLHINETLKWLSSLQESFCWWQSSIRYSLYPSPICCNLGLWQYHFRDESALSKSNQPNQASYFRRNWNDQVEAKILIRHCSTHDHVEDLGEKWSWMNWEGWNNLKRRNLFGRWNTKPCPIYVYSNSITYFCRQTSLEIEKNLSLKRGDSLMKCLSAQKYVHFVLLAWWITIIFRL